MTPGRISQRSFLGTATLLLAASAAATISWSTSMSAMDAMPMPGNWMMSMTWMRMPGQTWLSVAASFLGMWVVMMVAMMLPSLLLLLWRYREAVAHSAAARLGRLTLLVSLGYFAVWTGFGVIIFPLGAALASLEMRSPAFARTVPLVIGAVVVIVGALQFTAWKAHQLACCRAAPLPGHIFPARLGSAWRHGLRLGWHCCHCCAGLTVVLLVVGVMDLRVMAAVTAAITAERFVPAGERVARVIGLITIPAGLMLGAQAMGLG